MSKELSILNDKLPAHLRKAELDATTKALMGRAASGRRISLRGNRFRMMLNGEQVAVASTSYLDVVIVAAAPHTSRSYYEGAYDPDTKTAPTCYSADGQRPAADANAPQHKTCAGCPQDVKGSGKDDTRACRFSHKVAVVSVKELDDVLDAGGDVSSVGVYQISLPAMSVFGSGAPGQWPLQAYVRTIASKGVPVTALVTRIEFDEDASVPKVYFSPVRYLEEDEHSAALELGAGEAAIQAITQTPATVDGVIPATNVPDGADEDAPAPTRKRARKEEVEEEEEETPAPTRKRARKEEVEEEEEETPAPTRKRARGAKAKDEEEEEEPQEPTVRKGKKSSSPPPADEDEEDPALKAILDSWDD